MKFSEIDSNVQDKIVDMIHIIKHRTTGIWGFIVNKKPVAIDVIASI